MNSTGWFSREYRKWSTSENDHHRIFRKWSTYELLLKIKKESDPHVSFVKKKFKGKWSTYYLNIISSTADIQAH